VAGLAALARFVLAFSHVRKKHPNTNANNRASNVEFFCTDTILSYLGSICPAEENVS
jgi:hypothetical protein